MTDKRNEMGRTVHDKEGNERRAPNTKTGIQRENFTGMIEKTGLNNQGRGRADLERSSGGWQTRKYQRNENHNQTSSQMALKDGK